MADGVARSTPDDPPSVRRTGWPGQLACPGGAAARGVGTRAEVPSTLHAGATIARERGACPAASCRFATRTTSCPGHPEDGEHAEMRQPAPSAPSLPGLLPTADCLRPTAGRRL